MGGHGFCCHYASLRCSRPTRIRARRAGELKTHHVTPGVSSPARVATRHYRESRHMRITPARSETSATRRRGICFSAQRLAEKPGARSTNSLSLPLRRAQAARNQTEAIRWAMGNEGSVLERVPGVHPRLLFRVQRELSRFAPDVVQANGARTIKYGATLARLDPTRKWRLVYRNIDSPIFWVKGRLREHYYRRVVMPQVDGVVGVSETTLEEVRRFYRLRAPSVFVPNGVDLKALEAKDTREVVRGTMDHTVVCHATALHRQPRPAEAARPFSSGCR